MLKQDYIYNGKIINIVDGDTLDIMIDLGFNVYVKERFRLARINTPELTSKLEDEKFAAQKAKEWLLNFSNKDVIFKSIKKDKYGRYIAELFVTKNSVSINKQLLDLGLAKPYLD